MTHRFDIDDEIVALNAAPVDELGQAMAWVFSRIVDNIATTGDLATFRAWIVRQRMTGTTEEDLHTSTLVANDLARKLGVE